MPRTRQRQLPPSKRPGKPAGEPKRKTTRVVKGAQAAHRAAKRARLAIAAARENAEARAAALLESQS